MDGEWLDAMARAVATNSSRRRVARGLAGMVLVGGINLLGEQAAAARRRKKKRCKGGKRKVLECTDAEVQGGFCTRQAPTLLVCCPDHRIYAACPNGQEDPSQPCQAGEAEAPSVCCQESKLCGNRCCEGTWTCLNAATGECEGAPPNYARLKRG